jgi:hypothetical protein
MEAPIPVAVPIRRRNDDRDSARFSAAIVGRDGELAAWRERLREPALLAYHATRAAAWPEALTWLVRAGMQAMAQGASRAALRHLGEAVDIAQRTGTDGGDRLGLWRATMTDAEFRLGNMDGVVREGRLGLQVLGCPLPETTGAMMWTLVRLLFGRWWFGRTTAQLRRVVDEGDRVDRLVLIFERLTDAFGFKLDLPASIVSLQSWLHLAERHQRTGPLSLAWLMAFFWIAPTPMVARGRPWLRRARELARGVSDPTYRGTVAARAGLADLDVHDWESAEASASAVSVPSARCHRVCGGRLGLKRDGSAPGPTGRRPGLVRTRCGRPFSVLEPVPGPW